MVFYVELGQLVPLPNFSHISSSLSVIRRVNCVLDFGKPVMLADFDG